MGGTIGAFGVHRPLVVLPGTDGVKRIELDVKQGFRLELHW